MRTLNSKRALIGVVGMFVFLLIGLVPPASAQTTFNINSTSDNANENPGDGNCNTGQWTGFIAECTLRAAIQEANAGSGTFNIHVASNIAVNALGYSEIEVESGLPAITSTIRLDGTTHPSFDETTEFPQPRLVIRWTGSSAQWSAIRLNAGAAGSQVTGIAIRDFTASAIRVAGGDGYSITRNLLGGIWVPGFRVISGNDRHGIDFNGGSSAQANTVVANNIIVGNGQHGILIRNGFAVGAIIDNIIGLTPPFSFETFRPVNGNGGDGIHIAADAGSGIQITNLFGSRGNVISSNGGRGIYIGADGQRVASAHVGVPVDNEVDSDFDLADYGNGDIGIHVESSENVIGGENQSDWNVIGNSPVLMLLGSTSNTNPMVPAADNQVIGNRIGITETGENAGGQVGIRVSQGFNNTIDEAHIAFSDYGIETQSVALQTLITRSRIVDNPDIGVRVLTGSTVFLGVDGASTGNVIGGSNVGVSVHPESAARLANNWIGTDSGSNELPNLIGVAAGGGWINLLVGPENEPNVFGFNTQAAIVLFDGVSEARIKNNLIGLDRDLNSVPNGVGIRVQGDGVNNNRIGFQRSAEIDPFTWRPGREEGNLIADNAGAAISLADADAASVRNVIRGNLLIANGAGIDLGMTDLDSGGASSGPNDWLNPPDFDSARTFVNNSDVLKARYRVQTTPANAAFPLRIDFYAASGPDDAVQFLGSVDYPESAAFEFRDASLQLDIQGDIDLSSVFVVAQSTDAAGNSSQLSFEPASLQRPDALFSDRFEAP